MTGRMVMEFGWAWVCEFCFRKTDEENLPEGWELVFQSAVCPECHVKGGAFAEGGWPADPRLGLRSVE